MTFPNISFDIFKNFNDVVYYDEPHKYYIDNQQLTSVTTLIYKYTEPFDEEFWAKKKGQEFNLDPEDVLYGWNFINKKATTKGSIIHNYAENLFQNKVFSYPKDIIIKEFGYDPIYDEFLKTKKHVDDFYKDSFNKLIPIKTELVVYDKEYMIGGMVDLLVFNIKANKIQIWDYKTNSSDNAFSEELKGFMKGCLYFLEDNDINKYSLQLSAYKHIIEKNTNLKIGDCYLVWLSHKNEKYEIIKCHDYTKYAEIMFKDHKETIII